MKFFVIYEIEQKSINSFKSQTSNQKAQETNSKDKIIADDKNNENNIEENVINEEDNNLKNIKKEPGTIKEKPKKRSCFFCCTKNKSVDPKTNNDQPNSKNPIQDLDENNGNDENQQKDLQNLDSEGQETLKASKDQKNNLIADKYIIL